MKTKVSIKKYAKINIDLAAKKSEQIKAHNRMVQPITEAIKEQHSEWDWGKCCRMAKKTVTVFGLDNAMKQYNLNPQNS